MVIFVYTPYEAVQHRSLALVPITNDAESRKNMHTYSKLMELNDLYHLERCHDHYLDLIHTLRTQIHTKLAQQICNPLSVINTALQLIEEKHPDIQSDEHWSNLQKEINNLSDVIQNHCTTPDSIHLKISRVNIEDLLNDIYSQARNKIKHRFQTLSISLDETMLFTLRSYLCDNDLLSQAIKQIILYLSDCAPQSIHITLPEAETAYKNCIQGTNTVIIQISGNCSCKSLPQFFDELYAPSSFESKTEAELFVAQNIILAHGGILYINTASDNTTFTICLPI